MAKKKKKSIPFHIAHNYKQFELRDRFENKSIIKFWARDEDTCDCAEIYYTNKGMLFFDGTKST